PKVIIEKANEIRREGIGISAIGVGEYYNAALLQLLTAGQGKFVEHVQNSEDMYKAFEKQLGNLLFPIGDKARIDIIFNEQIKYKHLFGLPESAKTSGKVSFEIGNLYQGYNKVALAQFNLNQPDKNIQNHPVTIDFSYTDHGTGKAVKLSEKASLKWEPETGKWELIIDKEMKKLYAIAIVNQSLKNMVESLEANEHHKAIKTIESVQAQLKDIFPFTDDKDIAALVKQMSLYSISIDRIIQLNKK
ncbi:MAG: hypothetical protein M3Q58_12310, partial [Bacteroidota bacterium]|nr:hypothetical protein [Bacteroidota bacterium]